MKKFKVGDKVRVIGEGAGGLEIGTEAVVADVDRDGDVWLDIGPFYLKSNIELVPTTSARLTEAEVEIETLKAKVALLEGAVIPEITVEIDSKAFRGLFTEHKTPNQRRADVIKRAQAFVADLEKRAIGDISNRDGNFLFNARTTKLTFHVNAEKGVVTALAKGSYAGRLHGKAFAKCAPGDVFNADIGKAIAAGRLYGVDIPDEVINAPQPTEVVVGMRVRGNPSVWFTAKITERWPIRDGRFGKAFNHTKDSGWVGEEQIKITEDTDADYSEGASDGV